MAEYGNSNKGGKGGKMAYGAGDDPDGRECVKHPVKESDFNNPAEYQQGPTGYTGGGSNEKKS